VVRREGGRRVPEGDRARILTTLRDYCDILTAKYPVSLTPDIAVPFKRWHFLL